MHCELKYCLALFASLTFPFSDETGMHHTVQRIPVRINLSKGESHVAHRTVGITSNHHLGPSELSSCAIRRGQLSRNHTSLAKPSTVFILCRIPRSCLKYRQLLGFSNSTGAKLWRGTLFDFSFSSLSKSDRKRESDPSDFVSREQKEYR